MNSLHEPELVTDTKNAVGWFFLMGILTCGIGFVLGGMISPVFWPWCVRQAKAVSEKEAGSYERNLRQNKIMLAVILAMWFVVAWTIFIVAHIMNGTRF